MIIAIDGPAGSGKSTTAKKVAEKLKILHLDTGAMYRCITLKGIRKGIPFQNGKLLGEMAEKTEIRFLRDKDGQKVFMDNEDVSLAIRTPEVTRLVSDYCAVPVVRTILVDQQRKIGRSQPSVLEGRDIGTVVFPDADFKFYLVAGIEERAQRRQKELAQKGIQQPLDQLIQEIEARDRKDSTRENSPLRKAEDALEIDTSHLTIEQQVDEIVEIVKSNHRPGKK